MLIYETRHFKCHQFQPYPQNINPNSTTFQTNHIFFPNTQMVELGFMFWEKRLRLI